MTPLRQELQSLVSNFANVQAAAMEQSLRRQDARDRWVCNVMPLREQLELCYLRRCGQLGADLFAIETEIQPVLSQAVSALMPDAGFDATPRAVTVHRPSVQPLRQTVVLDLSVSWWKAWFAARPDPAERAANLKSIIEADFGPITAELGREAESYFGWYIAHTLDKARAVAESILASVRTRNEQLLAEFEAWQERGSQPGDDDFESRQCRRAVELSGHRASLVADIGELTTLAKSLSKSLNN